MTIFGFDVGDPLVDDDESGFWEQADIERAQRDIPRQPPSVRALNLPNLKLGAVVRVAERHKATALARGTRTEALNTVAEVWVDLDREVAAVALGDAVRLGPVPGMRASGLSGEHFSINGRIYVVERDGHAFPVEGPGLHTLTADEYRLLKALVRADGHEVGVGRVMDRLSTGVDRDRVEFIAKFARQVWRWNQWTQSV